MGCRQLCHDQGHHGRGRGQLWDADGHTMTRGTMDKEGGSYGMVMS